MLGKSRPGLSSERPLPSPAVGEGAQLSPAEPREGQRDAGFPQDHRGAGGAESEGLFREDPAATGFGGGREEGDAEW